MIVIDDVLISDEVVEEHFVCDLEACKGGCCVDGDAGAPLEEEEALVLEEIYEVVKPYLPEAHVEEIEKQGTSVRTKAYGLVTPTIGQGICVYGIVDKGIVKCGIEKAWQAGKTDFKKPVSCHLYPIRIQEQGNFEGVNYEPRDQLCSPACELGKKLKVPVYQFLKEAITRKYGEEFYEVLDQVAREKF